MGLIAFIIGVLVVLGIGYWDDKEGIGKEKREIYELINKKRDIPNHLKKKEPY